MVFKPKPPPTPNQITDKVWRVQNLYKIIDKQRKLSTLKFNRVQTIIVDNILKQKPIRRFDLKTRQQGVSTFWLLWWLDDTIFNSGTFTGILAHKLESLRYLMQIITRAYQSMPNHLRIPTKTENKNELDFQFIDSKIFCSLSIRSTALHNLHISEWCLCKDQEIEATIGATSEWTNISGESTGNGVGNHGYQTYQDAKTGAALDKMTAGFHPWFIQPEYRIELNGIDPKDVKFTKDERNLADLMMKEWGMILEPEQVLWQRDKKKKLKHLFKQEYPATDDDAFLTSGNKFFNYLKLHRLLLEIKEYFKWRDPVEQTDDYTLWENPLAGDIYAAGADCSEGVHDSSVLKILNVTRKREAFRYRAKVGVKTFYKVCDEWCRHFNNALLGVERNNHGHAVLLGLEADCRYPNLYKEENKTRLASKTHSGKTPHAITLLKFGWETTSRSRPLMLDHLKIAIEGEEEDDENHFEPAFAICDAHLLEEALLFEEVDGKFQAIEGATDDNIFATAIAYQMFQRVARKNISASKPNRIITAGEREVE